MLHAAVHNKGGLYATRFLLGLVRYPISSLPYGTYILTNAPRRSPANLQVFFYRCVIGIVQMKCH